MTLEITVGPNGNYHTIGEALEAVPYAEEAVLSIAPGIYKEKLFFEKRRITLVGAGPEQTVISWADGAKDTLTDGTKRGTFRSYTLFAGGEHITLRNLTIENTAGDGKVAGQAIALYADAACLEAENVVLTSHQDTLFCAPLPLTERQAGGFYGPRHLLARNATQQHYVKCKITGDIDFIFGGADAVFDECELVVRNRGEETNGYLAAPCECPGGLGFVFRHCTVRGEAGIAPGSVLLGRPWRPSGRAVYLNCTFDDSIHPLRFSEWGKLTAETSEAFFAEYGSRSVDGSALSLEKRNPWVRLLTDDEAEDFMERSFYAAWNTCP